MQIHSEGIKKMSILCLLTTTPSKAIYLKSPLGISKNVTRLCVKKTFSYMLVHPIIPSSQIIVSQNDEFGVSRCWNQETTWHWGHEKSFCLVVETRGSHYNSSSNILNSTKLFTFLTKFQGSLQQRSIGKHSRRAQHMIQCKPTPGNTT